MKNQYGAPFLLAASVLIGFAGISGGAEPGSDSGSRNHLETSAEAAQMITPCPSTPNCVSSVDRGRKHFIEPLGFEGSPEAARKRLTDVLNTLKRTQVVKDEGKVIHAECTSAIMRFVDDVEFFIDDGQNLIHVKSASRTGHSDLGVNRRRIEKIRTLFNERK